MAQQDPNAQAQHVDPITSTLRQIHIELTSNNLPNKVHPFSGETHKHFRQWLKDMDRVGDHIRHDPERMKRLTIDTLKGHAAEYFHRYLKENADPT